MPKTSGYLSRIKQAEEIRRSFAISFAVQRATDCAVIALHQDFGFGQERIKRFCDSMRSILEEMSTSVMADDKVDKELVYSQTKFDQAVQEAMGEYFKPWEERYP